MNSTTSKAAEPVIVRTPVAQTSPRESTAVDSRSIGSGIFQFREARASQQTLVEDEAPVPSPFPAGQNTEFIKAIAGAGAQRELAFRTRDAFQGQTPAEAMATPVCSSWSVYCNNCDTPMLNAHYHCSICDGGDYDLCEKCVGEGKLCPGDNHWLVKRTMDKNGQFISSTTETIGHKFQEKVPKPMPGAFAEESKTLSEEPRTATRTCNNCVYVLPEHQFVTCTVCEDFDLCTSCHTKNKHGHHPAHGLKPATEKTMLTMSAEAMLAPGRNVRHHALCDGCDKTIYGIRHKCLNCPDWDYCSECVKKSAATHKGHRFTAIYTPIADAQPNSVRHAGIYCDGPLCVNKPDQAFITGVRYKCAVCHDTDFCASCEALPHNHHNRTHPLIKFKTPVRNVSITTMNEDARGHVRNMGDHRPQPAASPSPVANAATQVQTMAEFEPTPVKEEQKAQPIPVIKSEKSTPIPIRSTAVPSTLLTATFVQDSIPDGMVVQPGARFTQIWTMKNNGPYAWPAGCSVRYVGGDNMLDVDNLRPSSVTDIAEATESNVVGREVHAGEEIAFKVTLKAPTREGKAISYWRLKAADGTPFGHRLWCDVEVKKADEVTSAHSPLAQQQQTILQAMQRQMAQREQMLRQLPIPASASSEQERQERIARKMAQLGQTRHPSAFKPAEVPVPGTSRSTADPEADKARKEAAKLRVEAIKTKILKARAEKYNRTTLETKQAMAAQLKAAAEKKSAEETEKVQKIIEQVSKTPAEETESVSSSQMVFPKLEKESPASSFVSSSKGKAAYVEDEEGEIESAAQAPAQTPSVDIAPSVASPSVAAAEDDFDDLTDLEVLSADGEESDDGFMTDEEYDILDASDHETVVSQ